MIIQRRFQGFSLKTFSQLIIINLIYSIEIFVEPTVRVVEAIFYPLWCEHLQLSAICESSSTIYREQCSSKRVTPKK